MLQGHAEACRGMQRLRKVWIKRDESTLSTSPGRFATTRWLGEKGSFEAVRLLRAVAEDLGMSFSFS